MDQKILEGNQLEGLTANEVWEKLYNKELNTKKHILEYIDITRVLKKEIVNEDQIKETYNFIYDHIEELKDSVKPNTMMFLKNNLKSQLGKYVKDKDPKPVNHFIEFFKEAYPDDKRRKDFTRVIMDVDSVSDDQLWTTLTLINRELLNNNLDLNSDQIKDIVEVIEKSIKKNNNNKFTIKLRSLKNLTDKLNISIVSVGEIFKIRHIK